MNTRTLIVLLAAGLAVGLPLVAPAASASPVTVDVQIDGFLVCVHVTTEAPLSWGYTSICTVP